MGRDTSAERAESFSEFMRVNEPPIRRALMSGYGRDAGREAALEAFEYGWEHWDRVRKMRNPSGYLYRAGSHAAARKVKYRPPPHEMASAPQHDPWVEPGLDGALDRLTRSQRTSVVLVHGFGWTYQEAADLLGVGRSTVQRHVDRAIGKLRIELEVSDATG
jgi:RNA polymerase sigma-70 factor (ECF subfamily)